jgi:hypothetical protein
MPTDNLKDLYVLFTLDVSPSHAGGSVFKCRKCGRVCYSAEAWFPCHNEFVPTKVVCQDCGTRWALKLDFTEDEVPTVYQ